MFTYNLIEIHLTQKMLGSQNNIDNADQPASQICGIRTGNIPMKVILVDCRARKIVEFNLARWASNPHVLLVRGTSPLARVFKLINNS